MKWGRKSEKKIVFLLLTSMIFSLIIAGCGKQVRESAQQARF